MPDYSNGKIYKIYSKTLDNCYYGSTVQTLKRRLIGHKSKFKKGIYCKSQDVLKYNDYEIILVELFACNSKKELLDREGYYQKNFKCVNYKIAGRTKKQYKQDHKEEIKIKNKKYKEDHKEEIKKYNEDHKEQIKKYKKKHYEANKEKISENAKIKMTCSCGSIVRACAIRRHEKSKKHISYIESQQPTV